MDCNGPTKKRWKLNVIFKQDENDGKSQISIFTWSSTANNKSILRFALIDLVSGGGNTKKIVMFVGVPYRAANNNYHTQIHFRESDENSRRNVLVASLALVSTR